MQKYDYKSHHCHENKGSSNVRSDIIDEVLSVEDKAQQIIRDANTNSRNILSDAQLQASEFVRTALKEERENNHSLLLQAEEDANLRLSEFEASLDVSSVLDEATLAKIAESITEKICRTELEEV
jgi:vacuolar-type H+-ATPase subunit H